MRYTIAMVKKVIATFWGKTALKVLGLMVGTGLVFCFVALLLPSAFTTGVGDWSDSAYFSDGALLRDDQMQASFILGICCALFTVAIGRLTWRYAAVVQHRKHRVAITAVAVLLAAWFAYTLGILEMASYIPG